MAVYLKPRVLIVLFLGFSSGLPLALSGATLLVWMLRKRRRSRTIGLFALVGTPYTLKFLWAPITDALDVPLLSRLLGRRRGWLVFTQILLMAAIVFSDRAIRPRRQRWSRSARCWCHGVRHAGHRGRRLPRRDLPENEQAAGMASYVAAYRIGMLVSTAGALFLVSGLENLASPTAGPGTGLHSDGGAGADRHRHRAVATEPERSAQAEAAHGGPKRNSRA